jgi:hypothetical protein
MALLSGFFLLRDLSVDFIEIGVPMLALLLGFFLLWIL